MSRFIKFSLFVLCVGSVGGACDPNDVDIGYGVTARQRLENKLLSTAAFELKCPRERLSLQSLQEVEYRLSYKIYGVSGCDRSATYKTDDGYLWERVNQEWIVQP